MIHLAEAKQDIRQKDLDLKNPDAIHPESAASDKIIIHKGATPISFGDGWSVITPQRQIYSRCYELGEDMITRYVLEDESDYHTVGVVLHRTHSNLAKTGINSEDITRIWEGH